jgi:hypothetical protein
MTGGIAGFPGDDITRGIPYVPNLTHHVSEYVAAFNAAGLSIAECAEPRMPDWIVQRLPTYPLLPDATRQAFIDIPYLLIWRLERPDRR